MPSLNKVILIGHVGKDPEVRYTEQQKTIANFTVATSSGKDKPADWHNIVAFDKTAEICAEYAKKGKLVYIEGKIQTRSWDDKDGVKRYKTEIVANNVLLLSGKEDKQQPLIDDAPF